MELTFRFGKCKIWEWTSVFFHLHDWSSFSPSSYLLPAQAWWSWQRPRHSRPTWTRATVATAVFTVAPTWPTTMTLFPRWIASKPSFHWPGTLIVYHGILLLLVVAANESNFLPKIHAILFPSSLPLVFPGQSGPSLPVQFCVSALILTIL